MLMTLQPSRPGPAQRVLRPRGVVELPLGVVVEQEGPERRPPWVIGETQHLDVPVGVAPGDDRSSSVRLQMRTGFVGPSSKNSISDL